MLALKVWHIDFLQELKQFLLGHPRPDTCSGVGDTHEKHSPYPFFATVFFHCSLFCSIECTYFFTFSLQKLSEPVSFPTFKKTLLWFALVLINSLLRT